MRCASHAWKKKQVPHPQKARVRDDKVWVKARMWDDNFGAFSYWRRQGERSGQWRMASVAQAVVLSAWQEVQGLGILYLSVMSGVMKAKVWERTFTSAMVVAILGMWQARQIWSPGFINCA